MADVPLLDEAAELLGVDDSAAKAARRAMERAQRLEAKYAQEVLDITGIADLGMVDAETLAAWNRDNGPALSTAERAEADRAWAYGHVIIDEAQELSAMAWRMVLRRNPSRSMTVVGDVAQTGSPAGARSWKSMLDPAGRRPLARGAAHGQLPHPGGDHDGRGRRPRLGRPGRAPPESVRSEGVGPRAVRAAGGLVAAASPGARADLAELGGPDGGRLAVIAPDARIAPNRGGDPRGDPRRPPGIPRRGGRPADGLPGQGPEFDRVVLADPSGSSPSPPTAATTSTSPSPAPPTA